MRLELGAFLVLLFTSTLGWTQQAAAPTTATGVLDAALSRLERQTIAVAEAMPEEKFSAKVFAEGMTFGQQVKHVAVNNFLNGATILGEKPPEGTDKPATRTTKAEILEYLKASFEYAHRALRALDDAAALEPLRVGENGRTTTRLGVTSGILAHGWNHYGQMVTYLRLNGIVPPESR